MSGSEVAVLVKYGLEALRFPADRRSQVISHRNGSVIVVERRDAVINVGKPAFKITLVLKSRRNVKLVIRLLVKIVTGNNGKSRKDSRNQYM